MFIGAPSKSFGKPGRFVGERILMPLGMTRTNDFTCDFERHHSDAAYRTGGKLRALHSGKC